MFKKLLALIFTISTLGVSAQLETSADFKRQVYKREYTFGISGHSRGYAVNTRLMKFVDGFTKQGLEIDLVKLRHPKEIKRTTSLGSSSNARGYVFNRINSFFTIRTGYIRQNILYDKTDQGTVAITLVTSGGLSLGLVKPIYIQIRDENTGGQPSDFKTVRYNPSDPDQSNPLGEANFFKGLGQTKLKPGIYAKIGVNFDYQLIEKKVTALEAGIIYDYFPFPQLGVAGDGFFSEVPIFYEEPSGEDVNWSGFFQMYIAFNFGFRKN